MIVLLLIIAGVASKETISSITDLVVEVKTGEPVSDEILLRIITVPILALTMGFLFLAGALGVWAIRTTAQIEGRRRIGRFVDAMDYLSDGIVAVDPQGRVTGLNPSARKYAAPGTAEKSQLNVVFPCLRGEEAEVLMNMQGPQEVECVSRDGDGIRALRFRSQPSEDMNLLLISDVTSKKSEEMRTRQIARLQLIGRIARGVAHDFNNILCAISGYASLMERQKKPDASQMDTIRALIRESQRGAVLAGQLLDLSRTGVKASPCEKLAQHIESSVTLLRVGLSVDWQVIADIEGAFSTVGLTDTQVEQVIVNLGMLVADEQGAPGFVHVRVRQPGDESLTDVGHEFAAVAVISAYGPDAEGEEQRFKMEADTTAGEAGVIQSVVRSMLEEVGGRFDIMITPGGKHSYRVCFPRLVDSDDRMSALASVPEEVRMVVANWKVLLASTSRPERAALEEYLEELGMTVEIAGDIVSALQHVEAGRELNMMVFDRKLLGEEADALLKAIRKLRPQAGFTVLAESRETATKLDASIVVEAVDASPETVLQAMLRSREALDSKGTIG